MLFYPSMLSLRTSVIFQAFMVDLTSLTMLDESAISLGALIVSKQETLSYNFWTSIQGTDRLKTAKVKEF